MNAPAFILAILPSIAAQDIDTALLPSERRNDGFLSEIEDPKERKAFQQFRREKLPARRLDAARQFVDAYPKSWLLAQAYESAAQSALELNDTPAAIQWAQRSLRLLPENPLLLTFLANALVQAGRFSEARDAASRAVEYFELFDRPAAIAADAWPRLLSELQASNHLVIGRAFLSEAIDDAGLTQQDTAEAAVDHLRRAASLSPTDMQAGYLMGLGLLALHRRSEALPWLIEAAQAQTPVREVARAQLLRLEPGKSIDALSRMFPAPPRAERPKELTNHVPLPAYSGSTVCRSCHESQYDAWSRTGMARMLQPYTSASIVAPFQGETSASMRPRLYKGRHYFEISGNGRWIRYPVDFTIGSKWQQAYATKGPDGQLHVFPLQFNRVINQWVNYWSLIDPRGSPRALIENFHKMSAATNYQMNCAPCHTSQLSAPISKGYERFLHSSFLEPGVNCEMCHGPSSGHVRSKRSGQPIQGARPALPVRFSDLNAGDSVAICAQCHSQSAIREIGAERAINYRGEVEFFRRYRSRPLNEFSRKAFYKDGRFRETTFIVEAFRRSRCFLKGGAHCGNCHNPHPERPETNPVSLKFDSQPDERCLQCHEKFRTQPERHTHHAPASAASRCEACHMPKIMNSLLFMSGTHTIDDKPDIEMTERFGQSESPNTCLLCHSQKNAAWVRHQLARW